MARNLSEGDPRNVYGDYDHPDPKSSARRSRVSARNDDYRHPAQAQTSRRSAGKPRRSPEETVRAVREGKPAERASSGLYDRLAEQFLSQDWVATHRGNTTITPQIEVGDTGKPLIAKILRDKITSEKRFEGRSEDKIEEVVEYAMKHFFDRLANDERSGRLVNRFVASDWWDTLIPEAIDHWVTVRIPDEAFERGAARAKEFYANWPKKERRPRAADDPVFMALARFQQAIANTDHPNYDDCEELE
jgi:hypothetical protein